MKGARSWLHDPFLARDAMPVRYMLSSCVCPSVWPSVLLSVTRRYCTKTAKRRIRKPQLYPSETELICFGSRTSLQKIATENLALQVDESIIYPVNTVRDLGLGVGLVILDNELSLQRHMNKVASVCLHHIRRLKQVRRLLGREVTIRLVPAFILNQLDYCNAVLAGLPKSTMLYSSGHRMPLLV